jgi:hypothetical protein
VPATPALPCRAPDAHRPGPDLLGLPPGPGHHPGGSSRDITVQTGHSCRGGCGRHQPCGLAKPGHGARVRPGRARPRRPTDDRAPDHRADRPPIHRPQRAEVCGLRTQRSAADGHRVRRHVHPLRAPRPSRRVCALQRDQTGRRPHRRRGADLRAVPPLGTRTARVRPLRQDRLDSRPDPRRPAGRVRELLPNASSRLQRVRQESGMQLRRQRRADLRAVLAPGHLALRPLRRTVSPREHAT